MTDQSIRVTRRGDGVAFVTLARAQVHNAFNEGMIADLTAALSVLGEDQTVRAVVLAADGTSFSAGADLDWMRRTATYAPAQNLADAERLAELMRVLNSLPKPTIARVQGAAFGGGVGLVACCDIAIAAESAVFCLSEVRLGLIPAVISPYVVAAIGARAARRWFLTAERFVAAEALRLGLLHRIVAADDLDIAVDEMLASLLVGAPQAQAAAKDLIFAVADRPLTGALIADTTRRIAEQRAGVEGREGVAAFLEKRPPVWGG
ncbi:enoyl-CoA hydratase/isomerase family protein [Magnetospirillum molischianum]|uniref:Enoyl-CoA hydratase/isomerase n=1 Tax=Magnetospirillum molischianum DSM 120 TaxID=1150626 RepID=H8FS90_MAGML|nr:enoyl-CoA hydratase/isomerase family protein [Magnetospirillum molischianum]CCG41228.1 Enoyl-CoA hydratase/isomerase [Magnetospirillum molischianum DSM 120]